MAVLWNSGGLLKDIHHREAVLHLHGHEKAGHHREVKGHVTFIAFPKVGVGVVRPLVGLRQQHAIGIGGVHAPAEILQEGVRFRQVLAACTLPFVEIGHSIQAQAVHAHVQPEVQHLKKRPPKLRVIEVQIRLV